MKLLAGWKYTISIMTGVVVTWTYVIYIRHIRRDFEIILIQHVFKAFIPFEVAGISFRYPYIMYLHTFAEKLLQTDFNIMFKLTHYRIISIF